MIRLPITPAGWSRAKLEAFDTLQEAMRQFEIVEAGRARIGDTTANAAMAQLRDTIVNHLLPAFVNTP